MDETKPEKARLIGLHLGLPDCCDNEYWVNYDIGLVAYHALMSLQTAVLAFEQIVTGEKLVNSLDVGDFYSNLSSALEVENCEGVLSEPGQMSSIQDEIQGLIDLVLKARRIAKAPRKS